MKTTFSKRLYIWINARLPLKSALDWALNEEIPGGTRFTYTLGSLALFLFLIQVISGFWQMFYYVPVTTHAYASLNYLRREIPFGWLIHGLHYWGANAFTVVVGLHILRVFVWGAYKKPREMVWLAGVCIVLMTVAFMFTGPVLAWDKKGYWAGKVGLSMAGSVPVFGSFIQYIFQGASEVGQLTLTRLFTLHVAIIPVLTFALIGIHLLAFRQFGSVGPWIKEKRQRSGEFWPDQVFKDILVIFLMFLLLVYLSAFVPAPVNGMADPMDTSYTPKPEWNFLFLYQTLKLFKGVFEPIGTVGIPTLLILLFTALPFMDKSRERNPRKRIFVLSCAAAFVVYIAVTTYIGYYSNPEQWSAPAPAPAVSAPVVAPPEKAPEIPVKAAAKEEEATVAPGSPEENAAQGRQLFNTLGCLECHTASGRPSNKVGPDLLLSLTRAQTREWLQSQLVDPKGHNPYTLMPAYDYLSREKLSLLLDFLLFLEVNKPVLEGPWNQEAPPPAVEQPVKAVKDPPPVASASAGQRIFETSGCARCHTASGRASNKVGPDLILALSGKGRSNDWLRAQLVVPESHFPGTIMPSYNHLGEEKIAGLVEYLRELGEKKAAPAPEPAVVKTSVQQAARMPAGEPEKEIEPAPVSAGSSAAVEIVGDQNHGKFIFRDYCSPCHGPEGRTGAPGFHKLTGVPRLNPIDDDLFDENPELFVRKVDLFIQQGMTNPSSGPNMPAFGKQHSLTQPQIADVEAYLLFLNGVDRARIDNPGIPPKDFFFVILGISVIFALLLVIYRWAKGFLG